MTASDLEVVDELAEYVAYCCAVRGNRESTVAGKLVAVKFFHEQWMGKMLPLNDFRIKAVKKRNQKGSRGRRHPATDEEAAVLGDAEGDGGGS